MADAATGGSGSSTASPKSEKSDGVDKLSELFSQVFTASSLVAAWAFVRKYVGDIPDIGRGLVALHADTRWDVNHRGLVMARRLGWAYALITSLPLVAAGVFGAHVYDPLDRIVLAMLHGLFLVCWAWNLPVKASTWSDHAAVRKPMDAWEQEVGRLKGLEYHEDPAFKSGMLVKAENGLAQAREDYQALVRRTGASNRSGVAVATQMWLIWTSIGLWNFVAILRARTAGDIALSEARHYLWHIVPVSAVMFGLPLLFVMYTWGAVMVPAIKVEGFWVFVRRAISAGLNTKIDLQDQIKKEIAEAKARGDEDIVWFAIMYDRGTHLMGTAMLKWMAACALALKHAMENVSAWAFGISMIWFFFSEALYHTFGNILAHTLRRRLIFRAVSWFGFVVYYHFWVMGEYATATWTPDLASWFKIGPFAPRTPSVTDTTAGIAGSVARWIWEHSKTTLYSLYNALYGLLHMSVVGFVFFLAIAGLVAWLAFRKSLPMISESVDSIKNKWIHRIALLPALAAAICITIAASGVIYHTIVRMNNAHDRMEQIVDGLDRQSVAGTVSCPQDPTGQGRPACRGQCYLNLNMQPPSDMVVARAGGQCFEP